MNNLNQTNQNQLKRFRFSDILKIFGIILIEQAMTLFIIHNSGLSPAFQDAVAILMMFGIMIGLVYNFLLDDRNNPDYKQISLKIFIQILLIIAATLIVSAILQYALNISSTANQEAILKLFRMHPIAMSVQITLFAPVTEELAFRYYALKPGKLLILRIVVFTTIFIMLHSGTNIVEGFAYLIPSLMLLGTRIYFNSAKFSLLTHISYNTIGYIAMVYTILH